MVSQIDKDITFFNLYHFRCVYAFHMFIVGCYLSSVLRDLQTSNVCSTLQSYLSTRTGFKDLLLTCFTQLLAGFSAFYLAYGVWSLRLTTAHDIRVNSFDEGCNNNLPLSVYSAALVEYTGTGKIYKYSRSRSTLATRNQPKYTFTNLDPRTMECFNNFGWS